MAIEGVVAARIGGGRQVVDLACRLVGLRRRHALAREHAAHADLAGARRAVLRAQALAQAGQQRVVRGGVQVVDLDLLRLPLAAGGATGDEGGAGAARPRRQRELGLALVASVDDGVHFDGQQAGPVGVVGELLDAVDDAGGVDVGDAARERLCLGHAQRRTERLDLAVDVGFGDVVEVDQHQLRDPAARERLDGPGADAAEADDGHARGPHARVAACAVQPLEAAEAALEIGVVGRRGYFERRHRATITSARSGVHDRRRPLPTSDRSSSTRSTWPWRP